MVGQIAIADDDANMVGQVWVDRRVMPKPIPLHPANSEADHLREDTKCMFVSIEEVFALQCWMYPDSCEIKHLPMRGLSRVPEQPTLAHMLWLFKQHYPPGTPITRIIPIRIPVQPGLN